MLTKKVSIIQSQNFFHPNEIGVVAENQLDQDDLLIKFQPKKDRESYDYVNKKDINGRIDFYFED